MSVAAYVRGQRRSGGDRKDVRRYASLWATVGGVATVSVAASGTTGGGSPGMWAAIAVVIAVTILTEFVEVRITLDRTDSAFTLGESSIAAAILLLPATPALLSVLVGLAVVQLARRRGALKAAFNLGQVAVAMAAALGVVALLPIGDASATDPGALAAAAAGMICYGLVNVTAMAGLLHRLSGRPWSEGARDHGGRLLASVLGNTAIGMLIAGLWQTQPVLLALLAAPTAAMHLSSRGSLRSLVLLDDIQSERDRLERVVAGASDGIVLVDADGLVELWSPAMAELTGVPVQDAVNRPAHGLLDEHATALLAASGEDATHTAEASICRPDGSQRDAHATQTPLFGSDGEADGTVIIVRDVTRQREIEAMKHDFVARVSHELRTPLTPIRGMAQALLRHRDRMDESRVEQALALIAERSEHMSQLVEDLLFVSRITSTKADLSDEVCTVPTDLDELVLRAVAWAADDHEDRVVGLTGTGGVALADPLRTTQVLSNLLSNAGKYSPAGSPIDVAMTTDGDRVRVAVADRGDGIPDDKKELVFERFQRLEDPMTMTTGGAGLGLFIARHLAGAMGGRLDVADRPGGGSVFTLELQAGELAAAHEPVAAGLANASAAVRAS